MNKQPNVLFLLSDQHSYRCFSYLDPNDEGEPVHTPTLDGLAADILGLNMKRINRIYRIGTS